MVRAHFLEQTLIQSVWLSQVLRLIDEPTSAALALFGIDRSHVHATGSKAGSSAPASPKLGTLKVRELQ